MQYVLPIVVIVVYLKGYYDTFASQSKPVLIGWMTFALVLLGVIFGVSLFTGRKKKAE